jgi:hypothetical protein
VNGEILYRDAHRVLASFRRWRQKPLVRGRVEMSDPIAPISHNKNRQTGDDKKEADSFVAHLNLRGTAHRAIMSSKVDFGMRNETLKPPFETLKYPPCFRTFRRSAWYFTPV